MAKKTNRSGGDKPELRAGPPLELPVGKSQEISPDFLLLDPQNLRLLETADRDIKDTPVQLIGQPVLQDRVCEIIETNRSFDIAGLKRSIIYNGFLKHERLIVARYDSDSFLVLEGNRRLTAVRSIQREFPKQLIGLSESVRKSLMTLPCFVLDGPVICSGSKANCERRLKEYRFASEVYIGMRHLMGAKSWEPASRYEFQARLILEEGWTPDQVADRFGRKRTEVLRDLKAQQLYRDFLFFEELKGRTHNLTYNAFAEAARSSSIMKWLEWSDLKCRVENKDARNAFFNYLISSIAMADVSADEDDLEKAKSDSAEQVVRDLSKMLKLNDSEIVDALLENDFKHAQVLFYDRREGAFVKRVSGYIRGLERVSLSELMRDKSGNIRVLTQLREVVENLIETLKSSQKKGRK